MPVEDSTAHRLLGELGKSAASELLAVSQTAPGKTDRERLQHQILKKRGLIAEFAWMGQQ